MYVLQTMVIMICLGVLSAYAQFELAKKVNAKVEEMEFALFWRGLFYLTVFFRMSQRILESEFV